MSQKRRQLDADCPGHFPYEKLTIQGFFDKFNGKCVDFDCYYGCQYVDLAQEYNRDVVGANQNQELTGFAAQDIWYDNGFSAALYTKIANTATKFPNEGDIVIWNDPVSLASDGLRYLYVLSYGGSVTKLALATGKLVATSSGSSFGFNEPTAIVSVGNRLFVANSGGNSVTEINSQTMGLVTVLSASSGAYAGAFDAPVGMVANGGDIWVTNRSGLSVTELSAGTGAVVQVVHNNSEDYLPAPGAIAYGDGFLFVASPPGSSPMVTQVVPTDPASLPWMMCNTNGPYTFSNPQSLVVYGTHLWVVNEGGAGGPSGDSLTEMNASTGSLIGVVR